MRKSFTAVVLVVGMALGSALTLVLNPVGAASALVGATERRGSHQTILQQALDTLVGKGTLTQVAGRRGQEPGADRVAPAWPSGPASARRSLPRWPAR